MTPPMRANGSVRATRSDEPQRAEIDVQQDEDAEQRAGGENEEPVLRGLARGVFAEELRMIAALEAELAHARFDFARDAAEVAAGDVAGDVDAGARRPRV